MLPSGWHLFMCSMSPLWPFHSNSFLNSSRFKLEMSSNTCSTLRSRRLSRLNWKQCCSFLVSASGLETSEWLSNISKTWSHESFGLQSCISQDLAEEVYMKKHISVLGFLDLSQDTFIDPATPWRPEEPTSALGGGPLEFWGEHGGALYARGLLHLPLHTVCEHVVQCSASKFRPPPKPLELLAESTSSGPWQHLG